MKCIRLLLSLRSPCSTLCTIMIFNWESCIIFAGNKYKIIHWCHNFLRCVIVIVKFQLIVDQYLSVLLYFAQNSSDLKIKSFEFKIQFFMQFLFYTILLAGSRSVDHYVIYDIVIKELLWNKWRYSLFIHDITFIYSIFCIHKSFPKELVQPSTINVCLIVIIQQITFLKVLWYKLPIRIAPDLFTFFFVELQVSLTARHSPD